MTTFIKYLKPINKIIEKWPTFINCQNNLYIKINEKWPTFIKYKMPIYKICEKWLTNKISKNLCVKII